MRIGLMLIVAVLLTDSFAAAAQIDDLAKKYGASTLREELGFCYSFLQGVRQYADTESEKAAMNEYAENFRLAGLMVYEGEVLDTVDARAEAKLHFVEGYIASNNLRINKIIGGEVSPKDENKVILARCQLYWPAIKEAIDTNRIYTAQMDSMDKISDTVEELAGKLSGEIAGLSYQEMIDNEATKPGLGITIKYGSLGSQATVFIYNSGLQTIPDGPENAQVAEQFGSAVKELLYVQRKLLNQEVTIESEQYFSGSPERGFEFRCADLSLEMNGRTNASILCVTGYQNHFIKIRVTSLKKSDPTRRQFVDEVSRTLWPNGR